MQEDRAAGRERQRVRDCVPVFWSVCSFFLRLLCVHVCVCAWVCWCVCVCVFAQFEGHPGRDCSADLSHPHTSPLFTWLSICPHIYHQKQISCWKQIQVSKLYLLHEATVNSEQIVCVCVCMEILTSLVLPIKGRRHGWKWYGGSTVFEQTHTNKMCCWFLFSCVVHLNQ